MPVPSPTSGLAHTVDDGKSLDAIKQTVDIPSCEEWAGVEVKQPTENIQHVFQELTAKP